MSLLAVLPSGSTRGLLLPWNRAEVTREAAVRYRSGDPPPAAVTASFVGVCPSGDLRGEL